ncbi:Protein phosphatase 2C 3 like protein [Verticillium longisporum]|nr:Protein phosphatase 2C 3 like protein [Verticillium longisporum]
MSKSKAPLAIGLTAAGGIGYYLFAAGGSPKVAEKKAEAKKADVSKHCKYYATGGTCGKKGKCRFVHDPEVREAAMKEREANNGNLTIQQRLVLNDKDQEDLTVLRSIQYLREKGKSAELSPEAQIVTAFPDVEIHDITDDDEFLVLACDGKPRN